MPHSHRIGTLGGDLDRIGPVRHGDVAEHRNVIGFDRQRRVARHLGFEVGKPRLGAQKNGAVGRQHDTLFGVVVVHHRGVVQVVVENELFGQRRDRRGIVHRGFFRRRGSSGVRDRLFSSAAARRHGDDGEQHENVTKLHYHLRGW